MAMENAGSGEALPARVETVELTAAEIANLDTIRTNAETKAEAIAAAQRGVASAAAKVTRQQEHLVGAQQALVNAQAELAALEGTV